MNIYAVYPDADAPEPCCNVIMEADDAEPAVASVRENGRFNLTSTAYAVPTDTSFLTRQILYLEDDRMSITALLRRILSCCDPFDYAFFGRIIHRVDAWSWRRSERKIFEAVVRHEIDRFWLRHRRRIIAMHLRILFDMIEPVLAPADGPESQYQGEAEEPEEEV